MSTRLLMAVLLLALPLGCTHATEDADKTRSVRSPGKPLHPLQVEIVNHEMLKAGVESETRIVVRSTHDIESMQVVVTPPSGMVLAEDRFQRYRPDFVRGAVELPLRILPASDGVQRVKIAVQATDTSGRTMSRTVEIALGEKGSRPKKRVRDVQEPEAELKGDEDAIVKGEQEIRRKN